MPPKLEIVELTHDYSHFSRGVSGPVPLALGTTGLTGNMLLGADAPRLTTGSGRDLDSLIGLILDTPRDRRVAVIAEELRLGLSYRELLTGLYLAAVRLENTHHVAVVHSAN
jgi:hypothetical protein